VADEARGVDRRRLGFQRLAVCAKARNLNQPPSVSSRSSGGVGAPRGAGECARLMPQLPVMTVVTPWLTFGVTSRSESSRRSSCVCASMNPGAAISPVASTSISALAASSCPIFAILPLRTPISPR
jgi:hypothetical protein